MSEFATYKNKDTGEIAKYLRSEIVPNFQDPLHLFPITVYTILIDGKEDRWSDEAFSIYWVSLPD